MHPRPNIVTICFPRVYLGHLCRTHLWINENCKNSSKDVTVKLVLTMMMCLSCLSQHMIIKWDFSYWFGTIMKTIPLSSCAKI